MVVFHGTTAKAAQRITAAGYLAAGEHVTGRRLVALDYAVLAMVAAEPVSALLERDAQAALLSFDVARADRMPDPAPESGEQGQSVLRRSVPVREVESVPVSDLLREHRSKLERWRALHGHPAAYLGLVR